MRAEQNAEVIFRPFRTSGYARLKRFVIAGLALAVSLSIGLSPLRADSFREIGVGSPLRGAGSGKSAYGRAPARRATAEITRPHPAVVRLIVPERDATSYGSGTLVDVNGRYGLVITNWHVVSDAAGPPTVLFADYFQSQAQIVKFDRHWDLAALVIWRPQVEPVAVAAIAPRPGDWLSIAGYGQGTYRQTAGRCTQYLAPEVGFPEEMVELAASARQGDSGGPIFNDRGELAGVLFGEGDGLTLGAYCGRVRQFLASVIPEQRPSEGQMVAHYASRPTGAATVSEPPRQHSWPDGRALAIRPTGPRATGVDSPLPDGGNPPSIMSSAAQEDSFIDWRALFGRTRAEQGKTLLAAIGAAALLLRLRRIAGAGQTVKPEAKQP